MVNEIWLAISYCLEPDDTVFFHELSPAIGGRRLSSNCCPALQTDLTLASLETDAVMSTVLG
jgi:hypothetical protein